jgi:hypothetical protein
MLFNLQLATNQIVFLSRNEHLTSNPEPYTWNLNLEPGTLNLELGTLNLNRPISYKEQYNPIHLQRQE